MAQSQTADGLEERLRSHARSFDSLLSLIPAKYYYGKDRSDQWQRKKKTREEARAAKMAKLDPDNYKSAKDILDEQQAADRKRKREQEQMKDIKQAETPDYYAEERQDNTAPRSKKRKVRKAEQKPNQKVQRHQASIPRSSDGMESTDPDAKTSLGTEEIKSSVRLKGKQAKQRGDNRSKIAEKKRGTRGRDDDATLLNLQQADAVYEGQDLKAHELKVLEVNKDNLPVPQDTPGSMSTSSTQGHSSGSDATSNHSGISSSTSILPPASPVQKPSPKQAVGTQRPEPTAPKHDPEVKIRLQARIEALRAARKADGPNGIPARSRQELLDARRQKEEARRAQKKEQRRRLKEDEARRKAETLAKGSPLLSPSSPIAASADYNQNFSFGRVDFQDGQRASANLCAIFQSKGTSKGPSDPATALIAAQKKEFRLAGLDLAKREDIVEKDSWLNARKRAQGERIRDDSNLLKKTLKRRQKQKKKSEKDWQERLEGVKRREEKKQKKREANVQKRKDQKTGKSKKGEKAKSRPGFEGSFRAKASSSGEGKRRR